MPAIAKKIFEPASAKGIPIAFLHLVEPTKFHSRALRRFLNRHASLQVFFDLMLEVELELLFDFFFDLIAAQYRSYTVNQVAPHAGLLTRRPEPDPLRRRAFARQRLRFRVAYDLDESADSTSLD